MFHQIFNLVGAPSKREEDKELVVIIHMISESGHSVFYSLLLQVHVAYLFQLQEFLYSL